MANKGTVPKKESLKGLRGWDKLAEDEFDEKYYQTVLGMSKDQATQKRINDLYEQFAQEYDLDELLPNDRGVLKSLVQSMILLDGYQVQLFNISKEGAIEDAQIYKIEKLGKICNQLTADISRMQEDLKITRKSRKSEKEQSTIQLIEDLKKKAKEFYEQKMVYIICPNCKTVLATIWILYPNRKSNFSCTCHREVDGKVCDTRVSVNVGDLVLKGSNAPELIPDSMK